MGIFDQPINKTAQATKDVVDAEVDHMAQHADEMASKLMQGEGALLAGIGPAATGIASGLMETLFQKIWQTRVTVDSTDLRRIHVDIAQRIG